MEQYPSLGDFLDRYDFVARIGLSDGIQARQAHEVLLAVALTAISTVAVFAVTKSFRPKRERSQDVA